MQLCMATGAQAQELDDLEDILNTPSPALDRPANNSRPLLAREGNTSETSFVSEAATQTDATATAAEHQITSLALEESTTSELPDSPLQVHTTSDTTCNSITQPQQLTPWNSVLQSASAPIVAAWAQIPQQLQRFKSQKVSLQWHRFCLRSCSCWAVVFEAFMQEPDPTSERQTLYRPQYILEFMARNPAATAAATVAGAAAGGAVAGPLGMAAGMPLASSSRDWQQWALLFMGMRQCMLFSCMSSSVHVRQNEYETSVMFLLCDSQLCFATIVCVYWSCPHHGHDGVQVPRLEL